MLIQTIDQENDRHHHRHETDQQPADAVHATVETGLYALTNDGARNGTQVGTRTGGHHHGGRTAADHVGPHVAHGRQIERIVRRTRVQLIGHLSMGRRGLLHRQRFTGKNGLADEQVFGRNQAQIGWHHVASGQMHDVTRNQLAHRHFDALAVAIRCATRHRGGVAHHRLEVLGGFGRTVFLGEAQQHANAHHHRDDDGASEITRIGEQLHAGQHQQHDDERVLECTQQLRRPMRWLLV